MRRRFDTVRLDMIAAQLMAEGRREDADHVLAASRLVTVLERVIGGLDSIAEYVDKVVPDDA